MSLTYQSKYRRIFAHRHFRFFWMSFTLSVVGDAMTRVALTWFVYSLTNSPEALGLLAFTYTAPVIIGGLLAGTLLDKFDRRRVMIMDNIVRGLAMLVVPLLYTLGELQLWHIYVVSAVYGSFVMFSLAGSPALVPDLVDQDDLETANALETLSYTVAGVAGPPVAGFLLTVMSAPNVMILDAISYFLFAFTLSQISVVSLVKSEHIEPEESSYRLMDAVHLLWGNKILLSTTVMFMAANIGFGALTVWLPIMADRVLGGGAELYGVLLGAIAVGEVASSVLTGAKRMPFALGTMICLAQVAAVVVLAIMIFDPPIGAAIIALTLFGVAHAPLTIWAQTLRMKIIPPHLRGRTFALLRTMMQGTVPVGGAVAGFIMPVLSIPVVVFISSIVVAVPGLIGYGVRELRTAN